VFISAIQALKLVERDATDGAVTTAFTAQHQTLLEQNNAFLPIFKTITRAGST
jgi:hypothetical protein